MDHHRPSWIALRQRLWPDCSIPDHMAEIAQWVADPTRYPCFGAFRDNALVGFIEGSIGIHPMTDLSNPVAFVEGLFVDESSRKKGIGRALIEELEKRRLAGVIPPFTRILKHLIPPRSPSICAVAFIFFAPRPLK